MSNQTIDEVSEILEYIMDNNTVPRNIREAELVTILIFLFMQEL